MPSDAPPQSTYKGSCHCGQVKYEVDLAADSAKWEVGKCNCTICHKKGYLSMIAPDVKSFKLLSPSSIDEVGDYSYGSKAMHHRFCKNCGTSTFARGNIEALGGDFIMINIQTVDNVDLSKNKPQKYWNGLEEKWIPSLVPVPPGAW
ncbi:hypothetical protein M378DRAFT_128738 [Amanita muscaria Koide BX008]|uniref:CENP-V/GFA domain-containing protein n=1 Tax=Amanita muscaria (strain Koide BX008) TaxID=946122 RepID=A0A0C2SHF2_AMAMK|nr:hypothetical protein M378DRAFT_128738 [Amanita muscaria Koide BX008]